MKGTFISSDYIKARDNSIRLLELNTDTVVFDDIIDVEFSWQPLIDFISGSYNELHIIHKPQLHYKVVQNLKDKVASQLPSLTVNESTAGTEDLYPPAVTDSDDKFILRMAYDDNAILDSEYCANSFNALKLMYDNDYTSSIVPLYGVSGSVTYDSLNTASYSANVPDLVVKKKHAPIHDVDFYHVSDHDSFKSALSSSEYITSFEISDESISDNVAWSYRNYSIVHGSTLSTIDLGTSIKYAEFALPSTSDVNISGMADNTALDVKHYYEFSTSTFKAQKRREGVFNTEHFISASGVDVALDATFIGQVLKSYHVEGMPDSDDAETYYNYEITGSSWPAGSQITGSVVTTNINSFTNWEGLLVGLKFSGSDERYYIGPSTALLTYHSGSDNIRFRAAQGLDEDDIYLIDTNNNIVDIEESKLIVLNDPTGSFYSVDLEPTDNIILGESNIPAFFVFHQNMKKCFVEGSKVLMADDSLLEIENIKVGDKVKTKEGEIVDVEDTYTYNVNSITKIYSNGELYVTDTHPLFIDGEWKTAEQLGWKFEYKYIDKLYNLKTNDHFIIEGIPASGRTHESLEIVKDSEGFTKILGNKKISKQQYGQV